MSFQLPYASVLQVTYLLLDILLSYEDAKCGHLLLLNTGANALWPTR